MKLEWLTLMPDASNLEQVLEGPHGSPQSWALRVVPETVLLLPYKLGSVT